MKIYKITNTTGSTMYIVAPNEPEARMFALRKGHVRPKTKVVRSGTRGVKIKDVTESWQFKDHFSTPSQNEKGRATIAGFLAGKTIGFIIYSEDDATWQLGF